MPNPTLRLLVAGTIASLLALGAGCTPVIPVKDGFGTSALVPASTVPPEFAAFNNYDPSMNALIADQVCATHYNQIEEKILTATPGQIVATRGRCQPYAVSFLP